MLQRWKNRKMTGGWSSSESVTEIVLGSHMFEIKGYPLTKGMDIGKCIDSKKFTIGGYEWGIQFYSDDKYSKDNSSYVSLFITLYSNATDVPTFYQIILLDQTPKRKRHVGTHYDHSFECGPCVFKTRSSMWGYNWFCNRKDLEASGFLKDDCLKIECTIGAVVTSCKDSSKLNNR